MTNLQPRGVEARHRHQLVTVGEQGTREVGHLPRQGLEAMRLVEDALLLVRQGQQAGAGMEDIHADQEQIEQGRDQHGPGDAPHDRDQQRDGRQQIEDGPVRLNGAEGRHQGEEAQGKEGPGDQQCPGGAIQVTGGDGMIRAPKRFGTIQA